MQKNAGIIENVKKYWDSRPCNIRHSEKPVGTREYFDDVEWRKYFVEPHIPSFADFSRWKGKKVLEIGCGIGTDTINFARNGALVTAVDISERSIEIAKRRAEVFGLSDNISFCWGNAEELTSFLPAGPYDLIYSFGVIHHSPHPEKIIDELQHYCKNGTVLKIMVYNRYSWKVLWIFFKYAKGRFWNIDRFISDYSEAQTGCPVTFTYSRKSAKRLLGKFGNDIRDIRVEHIFPYRIPDYVRHRYVKTWYFRWMPDRAFHFLEHLLGWHLCITAEVME